MPKVTYLPAAFAIELTTPTNVIALYDPRNNYTYAVEHKNLLVIKFNDDEHYTPPAGSPVATIDAARRIIAFLQKVGHEDIVVHCEMGISRSAAVAEFISCFLGWELDTSVKGCTNGFQFANRKLAGLLGAAFDELPEDQQEAMFRT